MSAVGLMLRWWLATWRVRTTPRDEPVGVHVRLQRVR